VPILDGFRRQNRAKEEAARVEIQQVRERDLGNQVETEARQAVLDLASAQQQVAIADERLRLAEQELAQAQERLEAGVAGTVETTNAQGSVASARRLDPGARELRERAGHHLSRARGDRPAAVRGRRGAGRGPAPVTLRFSRCA
jgi:outer membrane protein TolC